MTTDLNCILKWSDQCLIIQLLSVSANVRHKINIKTIYSFANYGVIEQVNLMYLNWNNFIKNSLVGFSYSFPIDLVLRSVCSCNKSVFIQVIIALRTSI